MPLTLEQGIARLEETISKDLRHKDYERVCKLAKEYTAFATGEDIDDLLIQYTPREDEMLFKQRKAVTQAITPVIINRLAGPMYKVARTTPTIMMSWKGGNEEDKKKNELNEVLGKFYGDESVSDYLQERFAELNYTDANTFIVPEFAGKVDPAKPETKAKPYPFEVNSEEAIDFKYINNEIQYLTVLNNYGGLNRYTMYVVNEAIVYNQIHRDNLEAFRSENPKVKIFYKDENNKEGEVYYQEIVPLKAGRVPARRVGVNKDLKTRGRTCVPFIHPAYSFLKKSIKAISEFDLATCLHLFPQKIQYAPVCQGDVANNVICKDGKVVGGEEDCKVCGGTGIYVHKSSADVIYVKMPKDAKDMVNLDNFISYKGPAMDLLEFMKKFGIYEITQEAIQAIYSSELLAPQTTTATATEASIDLESVYDALMRYSKGYASMHKHIVLTVAAYRSLSDGFTYDFKFPKDFKMKTQAMLTEDLQKANNSGASGYVKREINKDIIKKMYQDYPDEILKIEVKERYYPFVGKSENEINNIITNGLTTKFNQVLYANFEQIFNELEEENSTESVNFYKIEYKAQRELVKKKVEEFILAIDTEAAAARANAMGSMNEGVAGAGNTQDFNPGDGVTFNGQPVEIVSANPGPDGGTYKIKLQDGKEQDVTGKDLTAA